jgi:hypothetical protein
MVADERQVSYGSGAEVIADERQVSFGPRPDIAPIASARSPDRR